MQFGVRPASVGVAARSAHADLGAAVRAGDASAMGGALLGQGADLVGFQLERFAAAGEHQRVGGDVPPQMIAELLMPDSPVIIDRPRRPRLTG
ncbi:hypothetical protein J5U46_06120 [Micromonospora tulbaghiae]|uniref:Uncharacterized protein n=1 Tax=Micromonospora tulbaghiae TaxID=479978 RepID=A0AAW4JEK6_9ACTN|nr:hypothetical protein [Micromonospora tulbaghiae]MBO4139720.1 hypothetical protein [Micromonospora tulbaghiae]